MTRSSKFTTAATSLDGRRNSTRTAPRASSISRSTGVGAPAAATTCAGAKPRGIFAADRKHDGVAVAGGELVGLVQNDVERPAGGEEALDGGGFGGAQILIDHEQYAVGLQSAPDQRLDMPLVAVDRPGIDQAHQIAGIGRVGAASFDQHADQRALAGIGRTGHDQRRTRRKFCGRRLGRHNSRRWGRALGGLACRAAAFSLPLAGKFFGPLADNLGRQRHRRLDARRRELCRRRQPAQTQPRRHADNDKEQQQERAVSRSDGRILERVERHRDVRDQPDAEEQHHAGQDPDQEADQNLRLAGKQQQRCKPFEHRSGRSTILLYV